MPSLLIPDLDESALARLRDRASASGRSPEVEARVILQAALRPPADAVWAEVNALHSRLAASGRTFGDSAESLREDRDR